MYNIMAKGKGEEGRGSMINVGVESVVGVMCVYCTKTMSGTWYTMYIMGGKLN